MLAAHQDPRHQLAGVAGRIGPILPTGPLQRPPTVRNHVRVACKAVIFDIGGVLEVTPSTGWRQRWARRLGLELEEMVDRLEPIWSRGDLGLISLSDVEQQTANALALAVRPQEAILLDDVQECVDGARRVGMTAIKFNDNEQAIAELERHLE